MAETQHVSDDRIGNAVALELRWLSRVDSTHIATSVSGGIVTLTGTVATYREKVLAGEAVHRVRGVAGLVQSIDVHTRHEDLTDADIARECSVALGGPGDGTDPIRVTVAQRRITLSGQVPGPAQREAAVRAVACLKGVTGVENNITLRSGGAAGDLRAPAGTSTEEP